MWSMRGEARSLASLVVALLVAPLVAACSAGSPGRARAPGEDGEPWFGERNAPAGVGKIGTAAWTDLSGTAKPPAREDTALAFDPGRDRLVLFGGAGASGELGDLWERGPSGDWAERTGVAGGTPTARHGHAVVWSPVDGAVLLYGGHDGTTTVADTWLWAGTTWTEVAVGAGPPARAYHAMAWDASRQRVVLFGGENAAGAELQDTWEWDPATDAWTQIVIASPPPARSRHAMAYNPLASRTLLLGGDSGSATLGDTWEYLGASGYSALSDPAAAGARKGHAMVSAAARNHVVVFGGTGAALLRETREWEGAALGWSLYSSAGPSARQGHAMTYDSVRNRVVLFGGDDGALKQDTWAYTVVNHDPVLAAVGNKSVNENALLSFAVSASDTDGDALTLSVSPLPLPSGATFAAATGAFSWTPTYSQAGQYDLTFSVTDGLATDVETIRITVNDVNRAPTLAPIGARTTPENASLTFTVSGSDPDGDALTFAAGGLPAGATFTAGTRTFAWTPTCAQAGSYDVTFSVSDGRGGNDSEVVTIAVTGARPTITPSPLVFPSTRVGETATDLTVTIFNPVGASAFTVTGAVSSEAVFPIVTAPAWPQTVSAGGSVAVTLDFAPAAASAYAGTLTISIDDARCPAEVVNVSGQGQVADLSIDPASHDFGPLRVGAQGVPQTFTISNTGSARIDVESITLSDPANFTLAFVSPTAYPAALNAADEFTFTIRPQPASRGVHAAQVLVTTDMPIADPVIEVGVTVEGIAPDLVTSPSGGVDFGQADVQGAPVTRTVTIANPGSDVLRIDSLELVGAGASAYAIPSPPTLPLFVLVDGSVDLELTYAPALERAEELAASLHLVSDALGKPELDVPLVGEAIDRHLALSATSVAFGDTRRNPAEGPTLAVEVQNTGEADLVLEAPDGGPAVILAGTGASAFEVVSAPTAPIAGGASGQVVLRFAPAAAQAFEATLLVHSDDSDRPLAEVAVSGVGILANLLVGPAAVDAHHVAVGARVVAAERVRVENRDADQPHQLQLCVGSTLAACDETSDFHLVGRTPGTTTTLAAAGALELEVAFEPTAAANRAAYVLVFVDDDPVPEFSVALAGVGIGDVEAYGAGCVAAPAPARRTGGRAAGAVLVLALGLATLGRARARRARRARGPRAPLVAALLLAGLTVGAGSARAQTAGALDLGSFRPAPGGRAPLVTLERPAVSPHGFASVGLFVDYALNPLHARVAGSDDVDLPVSDRTALTLLAAFGVADRLELGLAMPMLQQAGEVLPDGAGLAAADGASLGDLSLQIKVLALQARRLSAGVSGAVGVPTGDSSEYAGAASATAHGRALVGYDLRRLRVAANVGYRKRGVAAVVGERIRQGDELTFGAGGALAVTPRVEALVEVFGARGLAGDDLAAVSPLEALLAGRWHPSRSLGVTVGAGRGLLAGVGAPDVRVFVAVGYAPRRPLALLPGLGHAGAGGAGDPLDRDGDGVGDDDDRCPRDPEDKDGFQDGDGCPDHDNDGDQVPDPLDECPAEPEDIDGHDDLDGCIDPDDDGDGVLDVDDRCPDSVEDVDGYQDADGCDDPDNDRDGILDVVDECALEAETINGSRDEDGCPDAGNPLVVVKTDRLELLAPVAFAGDTATLKPASRALVGQIAAHLRAHPEFVRVRVGGHVAGRGRGEARDQELSQQRAEAVLRLLVELGVEEQRLEAKGHGSSRPLDPKGGRAANDRVEIVIVKVAGK